MNKKMKQKIQKQSRCVIKRVCVLGMTVMMAASLAGCGTKTGASMNANEETTQYEEKYMSNDETIKYEGDTSELKINADIKPSPEQIPEVKLTLFRPDEKTLVKELLQEGMRTEFYNASKECIQYSGKNGDTLNINKSGFYMLSNFWDYLFYCFHWSSLDPQYNADKYSRTTDFEFMSRQEALELVIKKLEKCGVKLGDYDVAFYCLDYKTLKEEENVINQYSEAPKSEWKDSWTEDDNCYYIVIRQKFNDIPEYHPLGGVYERYEDYDSPVQAVVSKDGIRYIEVDYAMQFENTGILETILTPQQVLDKVIEEKCYVDEGWEKQKYTLTKMNLCYFSNVSDGNILNTTPVYQFYIKEKYWDGNDWGKTVKQLVIDARTGEKVEVYDSAQESINREYH